MSSITKSIIFYTDSRIKDPIKSMVEKSILDSNLPIVSSSLQPLNLGNNEVMKAERCYPTMVRQIISCLERSRTEVVFFCEHDVIYSKSHFDFTPEKDNIFYYNTNNWRWDYPKERYVTYDRLVSLSSLCVNRQFALEHYKRRLAAIQREKHDHHEKGEPDWVRKMGYEPGTKKVKRGGFSDDDFDIWRSTEPLIDIRHDQTFSPRKVNLSDFKHPPLNWREKYERP